MTPRHRGRSARAERRERELALRRSDVLAAASRVFAEKGFSDARVAEIAAASELSLASVYSMFKGKEELYQEVITTTADSMREAVQRKVEAVPDPAERLLALVDALFAGFEENRMLLRMYARGTQGLPWKIRQAMGESALHIFQQFTAWVVGLVRKAKRAGHLPGLDPESVALSLIGTATTTAAHWIETTPDRPLTEAAPLVRALLERVL